VDGNLNADFAIVVVGVTHADLNGSSFAL
jgi:hypothetical protein